MPTKEFYEEANQIYEQSRRQIENRNKRTSILYKPWHYRVLGIKRKPKLFMMIGIPASGKSDRTSNLAKEYNAIIHASDDLRSELKLSSGDKYSHHLLFQELHKRIKFDLANGCNVIYDATNINYKTRKAFLEELRYIPCEKIAVIIATPYKQCLDNNAQRIRCVPVEVIKRMYENFTVPYWYEGWDDIQIVYSDNIKHEDMSKYFKLQGEFDQCNKHHTLSLQGHMDKTLRNIKGLLPTVNYDLERAAMFHDIGKPFTQSIDDSGQSHYYNHHKVGAYDSLFIWKDVASVKEILHIATLIQWHMQPYFWEKDEVNGEKQIIKYSRLWGKDLYNEIMLLYKADKMDH